jgi:hypothetical protein
MFIHTLENKVFNALVSKFGLITCLTAGQLITWLGPGLDGEVIKTLDW